LLLFRQLVPVDEPPLLRSSPRPKRTVGAQAIFGGRIPPPPEEHVLARSTVFRSAKVFDGEHFLPGPHDVVTEGERITAVRPTASSPVPEGAAVIECAGKTVVPGFIDCHVHLMISETDPGAYASKPFSLPYYEAIGNARALLESGVTSVRDAGGADAGLRAALAQGLLPGPRTRISVGIISTTGGHGDFWQPSGSVLPLWPTSPGNPPAVADGPDEVRKLVRTLFRAGADQIKICASGGVMSPTDDSRHAQFTEPELRAAVEEAEERGSYVLAHAHSAKGIRNAVRAGVRSVEHAIFVDDEGINLMVEHGTVVVPTLTAPRQVLRAAAEGRVTSPQVIAKAQEAADAHQDAFARLVAAGVRIAMGSDAGMGPHGSSLEELPLMAAGGLSLEGVLTAATSTAADLLGDHRVGRVRPDALADLVVVDGDLDSTGRLGSLPELIRSVWQGGVLVKGTR
jgi:imidazolonepropionase-like amidohydrolase